MWKTHIQLQRAPPTHAGHTLIWEHLILQPVFFAGCVGHCGTLS